ncbi:hypothetical protein JW935_24985 [candidate division KSB1 bacterium]|nr:hypothetical protein [candidate division KSB1 bacterium]
MQHKRLYTKAFSLRCDEPARNYVMQIKKRVKTDQEMRRTGVDNLKGQ